jgi:predicted RNase H-like nuclease
MNVTIIGIDCATVDHKTGLALGMWEGVSARVEEARVGSHEETAVDVVSNWARTASCVLLAMDAPLGWPASMGKGLAGHEAGQVLSASADEMFHRMTDEVVKTLYGRRPLEVGANLIARTAHSALRLMDQVAAEVGKAIPLAWDPARLETVSAIEVYPAATLSARGIPASGYKAKHQTAERDEIAEAIADEMELPTDRSSLIANADVLDAVVCVLAAVDFLGARAKSPGNALEVAKKEGWIWVREPDR